MSEVISNNKRIAKNTLLLYCRMLFSMGISLYTSRVVLNELGIDDYGIYNVVGGIVAMFHVISGALSSAISRFITFELGRDNTDKLKKVFSSAITIQIFIAIIIIILAESIGLWFLNNKMVIPIDRLNAAHWVYQFSIVTFAINLISVPYNAAIIAHEKMSAFAYIGIIEVISKLVISLAIAISPIDKLIFYGQMLMIIAVFIRVIYTYYCKKHFEECSEYKFIFDKVLFKEMFGFAGWNFIGSSSAVLRDQGGNILINMFNGPEVNAARGLAMQVSAAIQGFVTNFMTALNPQITKSYASGQYDYMMTLIFQGARLSYYILLLLSLPVIFNAQYLLSLWLETVPDHTVAFVQLILIFAMSESLAAPLVTAMLATGDIRNYQLVVGGLQLLNMPISYVLLRFGYAPEVIFIVAIFISVCCEMARLYMLRKMIKLPVRFFISKVYFNVIGVTLVASIIPFLFVVNSEVSFMNFLVCCLICVTSTMISIYFIGCDRNDRELVMKFLNNIIQKIKNR